MHGRVSTYSFARHEPWPVQYRSQPQSSRCHYIKAQWWCGKLRLISASQNCDTCTPLFWDQEGKQNTISVSNIIPQASPCSRYTLQTRPANYPQLSCFCNRKFMLKMRKKSIMLYHRHLVKKPKQLHRQLLRIPKQQEFVRSISILGLQAWIFLQVMTLETDIFVVL